VLPSFFVSKDSGRSWRISWALGYGAVIGLGVGIFRALNPLQQNVPRAGNAGQNLLAHGPEIASVVVIFALLCAGCTALRNFLMRRLISPEDR
jgi:hypothetical protein